MVGLGRFGVAFVATAAVALGSALPAYAQEGAAPAETTASETTPAETTEPQPAPTEPEPAPTEPEPAPDPPAAEPDPPPATTDGGTPESAPPAPDATPAPDSTPAEEAPAESTTAPEDAVKLEEPDPAAAAPAATPTPAAPQPAAAVPSSGPPPATTIVLVQAAPATATASVTVAVPADGATNAEAAATAAELIVSFRPRAAASPIALLPEDEPAVKPLSSARPKAGPSKRLVRHQSCARPSARVPLSQLCKQARAAAAVLRVPLTSLPSPEVRAAIARGAATLTARKIEARPPPDSKAAKKHPVAEVRPTVPFGDSGQGFAKNGFNGSAGTSTSSSRLFALAAVPLRVPRPFRFSRLRLPSTVPHGVIAAPPTARPG